MIVGCSVIPHRNVMNHQMLAEYPFRVDLAHVVINTRSHQSGDSVHHNLYEYNSPKTKRIDCISQLGRQTNRQSYDTSSHFYILLLLFSLNYKYIRHQPWCSELLVRVRDPIIFYLLVIFGKNNLTGKKNIIIIGGQYINTISGTLPRRFCYKPCGPVASASKHNCAKKTHTSNMLCCITTTTVIYSSPEEHHSFRRPPPPPRKCHYKLKKKVKLYGHDN